MAISQLVPPVSLEIVLTTATTLVTQVRKVYTLEWTYQLLVATIELVSTNLLVV
jgi:hypothetical protein